MPSIDWVGKLRHLLQTLAFCLSVAALQAFFIPTLPYVVPAVYSSAIAVSSWALIDFGRHAFPSSAETGWPQGWQGLALPMLGLVAGFLIGTLIGDRFLGNDSFHPGVRPRLLASVLVSAVAGAAITYWFYSRSKGHYLEQRMVEARRQAAEVRLKLLESQLEPHMLFNTLANLRVLIAIDATRAQSMLDCLIAFLRATLSASRATQHPLQAEFDRLRDYLSLMALRMGPRLAVRLQLPAELRGALLPPLLLQPLVENAIKHGLEPHVEGGRIEVSARRDGGDLVIDVRDTGIGIGTAAAAALPGTGAGVGTQLVRERLAALALASGAPGTLSLQPAGDDEGGTLAQVRLPLLLPATATTAATIAASNVRPEPEEPPPCPTA